MSETQVPGTPDQASDSAPAESAGALLRQARERVGLHIAALAVMIRVPVKKLEALETDRLDLLPDLAFTRALASSVCRALKIEPAPVLERLPQTQTPRLWTEDASINVPFRGPGDVARELFWHQFPKPVIVGVFLLLLGALALVFFPDDEEGKTAVKLVSSEVEQQAPLPLPLAAPVLVAAPAALPVASEAVAALPAVVLTLRTKSASWIEVTDAQGVAQLRRIVEPGENTNVSGALPLTVVVGRSDATAVWIRGKAFALEPVTSQNVARFEVK